jgi:hypothetical protein
MAFTFKLENPDGTPADPPTLEVRCAELEGRRSDSARSGQARPQVGLVEPGNRGRRTIRSVRASCTRRDCRVRRSRRCSAFRSRPRSGGSGRTRDEQSRKQFEATKRPSSVARESPPSVCQSCASATLNVEPDAP